MSKITIRFEFSVGSYSGSYIVCVDGKDIDTLSNRCPRRKLLLALVMKYKDLEEAPVLVVNALHRHKARYGKDINPKLPHAPLSCERIKISSREMESGWDYVVIEVTTKHPDGSRWQQVLRSPHYSKGQWNTIRYFIKKRQISDAELFRLRRIACKEKGPVEIKMVPYDYGGWRGQSA